ncbi:MYG1 exonuclease isoform X2 [Falco naumanni]|uniref:MYG1 exonuclease isoform X2 n=1 Tax=Falco naumanni TaxID=148594 RepID=UPI001ADDEE7C|nr:MYG1 exonuclease isoform X2 [Falco naumanni]
MQSMRSLRPDKPWTTKLSSAGLVYCHFGSQILAELLGQPEDSTVVTVLYDKLYENFVQEIDAIDNGIAQAEGEPRYALTTTLSARVGHLNPRWNDPDQDTEGSGGRWSWSGASSWTGSTTTTVPGCLRGYWWRRPSGDALRWMPAGWCWSSHRVAAPGRSTSSAWSRSWRCRSPSSWCCSPTAAGSGGCRASQRGHTPSRAASLCPSPGEGSGTRRCPSSPASPAASSYTPAASSEATARGKGPWRWPGRRWRSSTRGERRADEPPPIIVTQKGPLAQRGGFQGCPRPSPLSTCNGIALGH